MTANLLNEQQQTTDDHATRGDRKVVDNILLIEISTLKNIAQGFKIVSTFGTTEAAIVGHEALKRSYLENEGSKRK